VVTDSILEQLGIVPPRKPRRLKNLRVQWGSLVTEGANPGSRILIAKGQKGGNRQPMVETKETIKELALSRLDQLAEVEKKNNPQLTPEAAYVKALSADEGRSAYTVSVDPDSDLTLKQYKASKIRKARMGGDLGNAVCVMAKALCPEDPWADGLRLVHRYTPGLMHAYLER